MEALGTTAALTEILKILRGGIEFCQSFADAPWQLKELAKQFQLFETEVQVFRLLTCKNREWLQTNKSEVALLNQYICDAAQDLRHIQVALTKEVRHATWRSRLRWALYGKDKTEVLLRKLIRLVSSMNLVISLLSKIELEDVRTAGVDAELSLLAAKAGELNTHRLRSGRSFQARMRCVSSADDDAFSWHSPGLKYPLRGELDVSAALQAASGLATPSNSTSLLYGSRPKALTRTVLRLRLKNWLVGCGFSEGSKTSSSLVSNTAPIMQAAQSGDILALRRILRSECTAGHSLTNDKLTPIAVATQHGHLAVVRLLLEEGVDMEAKFGRLEITALAQALRCRRFDITKFLTERGASFSSRNISGWSPLFYLWAAEVNPSASQYLDLLRKRSDFPLLHEGVYDADGWSVMHRAACFGTASDVKHLIRLGVNPFDTIRPTDEETECDTWTVLHAAVWYGARASVNVLALHYEEGPGVDVTDDNGCTPLHLAILRKQLAIAAILLRHGADPLKKTRAAWQCPANDAVGWRYNAVMLAAEAGHDFQQQFGVLISGVYQSNTLPSLPNVDSDYEVEYSMVKLGPPRLSEEPTSSTIPQHEPPGHHYPAIYVSGNARVQLGDRHCYGGRLNHGNINSGGSPPYRSRRSKGLSGQKGGRRQRRRTPGSASQRRTSSAVAKSHTLTLQLPGQRNRT